VSLRRTMTTVRLPQDLDQPAMILSRIFELGESNQYLEIATSESECENSPPELLGIGAYSSTGYFPFRISPNGQRFLGVAYHDSAHIIYSWGPDEAEGNWLLQSDADFYSQTAWYDDTTVGFTKPVDDGDGGYFFEMYLAPDKHSVLDEDTVLILTCEETPEELRVLPTGQFMFRGETLFVESEFEIYRMDPVDGMYDCSKESDQNVLLNAEFPGSNFDVSLDGQRLVFQAETETGIYTAFTDGMDAPVLISPEDTAEHRYPQFALNGEQVVWSSSYLFDDEAEVPLAEGNFARVYRANFDGSYPFILFQSDVSSEETIDSTTGNQRGSTCSFGLPLGSGSGGLVALGLGVAAALRRRRMSKS
jgi:hypothetical protein